MSTLHIMKSHSTFGALAVLLSLAALLPTPVAAAGGAVPWWGILLICLAVILLALIIFLIVYMCCCPCCGCSFGLAEKKRVGDDYAPKNTRDPITAVVIRLQNSEALRANAPKETGQAVECVQRMARDLMPEYKCYESVVNDNGEWTVISGSADAAVRFAYHLHSRMRDHEWNTPEMDRIYREIARRERHGEKTDLDSVRLLSSSSTPSLSADHISEVWSAYGGTGPRIGMGIHTGFADAIVFDEEEKAYRYDGFPVVVATRAEGQTNGPRVLLTEDAYKCVTNETRHEFTFIPTAHSVLAEDNQIVPLYTLRAALRSTSASRRATEMVSRTPETSPSRVVPMLSANEEEAPVKTDVVAENAVEVDETRPFLTPERSREVMAPTVVHVSPLRATEVQSGRQEPLIDARERQQPYVAPALVPVESANEMEAEEWSQPLVSEERAVRQTSQPNLVAHESEERSIQRVTPSFSAHESQARSANNTEVVPSLVGHESEKKRKHKSRSALTATESQKPTEEPQAVAPRLTSNEIVEPQEEEEEEVPTTRYSRTTLIRSVENVSPITPTYATRSAMPLHSSLTVDPTPVTPAFTSAETQRRVSVTQKEYLTSSETQEAVTTTRDPRHHSRLRSIQVIPASPRDGVENDSVTSDPPVVHRTAVPSGPLFARSEEPSKTPPPPERYVAAPIGTDVSSETTHTVASGNTTEIPQISFPDRLNSQHVSSIQTPPSPLPNKDRSVQPLYPMIQYENGRPTVEGDHIVPCFSEGNGLLFRIIDTKTKTWSYYNDTQEYIMVASLSLGRRSDFQPLDKFTTTWNSKLRKYEGEVVVPPLQTVRVLRGAVNGYSIGYAARWAYSSGDDDPPYLR